MPLLPNFEEIRKGNQAQREARRKARAAGKGAAAAAAAPAAAKSLAHPVSTPAAKAMAHPRSVASDQRGSTGSAFGAQKPTRGSHHAAPTGTPPKARPYSGSTTFSDKSSGSFVDRAKVAKESSKAASSTKKSAAAAAPKPVTAASPAKPRPESAPRKGGLAGLLGAFKANKGNNEELARQRMIKAARKD